MPHVQNAPQNLKFYYVQVKIIGTLGNEVKKKKQKISRLLRSHIQYLFVLVKT